MPAVQPVMDAKLFETLRASIAKKCHVTLTFQRPQGWRMFKGAFEQIAPAERLAIRARVGDAGTAPIVPEPGETVGVTFRTGHKKCMFASKVVSIRAAEKDSTVTLRWPAQIQLFQRRVFERVTPPSRTIVAVRFWSEPLSGESEETGRAVRHGQLEDLSVGGMRVKVPDANVFEPEAVMRCVFAPRAGRPSIVLDALVRHREAADEGRASVGFQFVGLETTPDGRQALDRLAQAVSYFQRYRSRRR